MNELNNISFKQERYMVELFLIHPILFYAFLDVSSWAYKKNLPIIVTNVLDKQKDSETDSHPQGRAIDISVIHWPDRSIREADNYFDAKYGKIAAISGKTGKPNFFVYHKTKKEGSKWHIHLQINAKYRKWD